MIRAVKNEIRIIAWDDARLSKRTKLVGVVTRGGGCIDGLLTTMIERDGIDATEKIAKAITSSRQYGQIRVIMLDGISFGGLNIVDIKELFEKANLPVIVVQKKLPNIGEFKRAIMKTNHVEEKLTAVEHAGKFYKFENKLFFQRYGLNENVARKIIKISLRGGVPNPLRMAHIIASGLSGESRGGV